MNSQSVHPSRLWYLPAGAFLAGAVTCIALGVLGFFSMFREVGEFLRVDAPGTAEVTFTEPGRYDVFVEGSGVQESSGSVYVFLQTLDSGPPVAVRSSNSVTSYHMGRHEGRSIGSFRIDEPSRYVINVFPPTDHAITNIAIGPSSTWRFGRTILLLAVGFLLGVAALIAGVMTAVLRRSRRTPPVPQPWVAGWPPPGAMSAAAPGRSPAEPSPAQRARPDAR